MDAFHNGLYVVCVWVGVCGCKTTGKWHIWLFRLPEITSYKFLQMKGGVSHTYMNKAALRLSLNNLHEKIQ